MIGTGGRNKNLLKVLFDIYSCLKDYFSGRVGREHNNFSGADSAEDNKEPLVIYLNKNGKYTNSQKDGTHFDFEGDGFAEKTSWIESGDGLLVRDINNNGIIDDGELFELKELDITSILLNYTSKNFSDNDSTVTGISIVNKGDGGTFAIGNLKFSIDTTDTLSKAEIEVPDEIRSKMPQLYASGNILSLQEAMTVDNELLVLVNKFINTKDMVQKNTLMDKILLRWTGCENIESGSRGGNIDATKLAVIVIVFELKVS